MLKKFLILAIFLLTPVSAFAGDVLDLKGSWVCEDQHPYWKSKNLHLSFFQKLMDNEKAIGVYSLTFFDGGANLEFVVEFDWSTTKDTFTIKNEKPYFFKSISKQDFRLGKYTPLNNEWRNKMIEVLNGIFKFSEKPVTRTAKMSKDGFVYGKDDRFQCAKAKTM